MKVFRRRSTPDYSKQKRKGRPAERFRGSARERGYDGDWERAAKAYKISVNYLCEECLREGIVKIGDVVDHMIPLKDAPELRLDSKNFDCLCHAHHNGLKRRVEAYARKARCLTLLPQWMKFPETRPVHFQIRHVAKSIEVAGGMAVVNGIKIKSDDLVSIPLVCSPDTDGIDIFPSAGILVSASNNMDVLVSLFDGENEVFILNDGQSLSAPMQFSNGFSLEAHASGTGKVSLAYVDQSER